MISYLFKLVSKLKYVRTRSIGRRYHGGCSGCVTQAFLTPLICNGCQYKNADWGKPKLKVSVSLYRISGKLQKLFINLGAKSKEKAVFHGGCLSCKSQEFYGLKRCTGCQYFTTNSWDSPDLSLEKPEEMIERTLITETLDD